MLQILHPVFDQGERGVCMEQRCHADINSIGNRRLRATPVITSTFENVSDIGVCLGLSLGPPANAGVRSKQGALQR